MVSLIDLFPAELWIKIFKLACVDGGLTGRSLSLVSHDVMTLSKPAKYHSLALINRAQIFNFHTLLHTRSLNPFDIHHLFVTCLYPYPDGFDVDKVDEDFLPGSLIPREQKMAEEEAKVGAAIYEILASCHCLLTLALHLDFNFPLSLLYLLPSTPSLLRLTVHCQTLALNNHNPSAVQFPSLRRLTLAGRSMHGWVGEQWPESLISFVKTNAPSLTHLRAPVVEFTNYPELFADASRFPDGIEKILIEVPRYAGATHCVRLDTATYRALMKRVTTIALRYSVGSLEVQHHWEDEISGGEGPWDRNQYYILWLQNVPPPKVG